MYQDYLDVLPEIQDALKDGKPVVALESTIISHGMPYPENEKFANDVEGIIRSEGAVPATIAVINGRLKVGLTPDDLSLMASGKNIAKVSRRDLPYLVAMKQTGATTVTTTMMIAAMAGIKVFATGGIGGVHRGAPKSFDISADLQELAHTNVAVVCAGCKSILDIGLTLEYLETFGVPVLCMGTKKFPAFYCKESGFEGDYECDTPEEAAAVINAKWDMGLDGGVLIANPIPDEWAMDPVRMNKVIDEAVAEAERQHIHGKNITPFLLARIKDVTGGDSLASNIQLAFNNARMAARIAAAMK
ncbi:MAG: pseudouridine-5'-phosphate glycosidase [Flexilinea sp.]|nr:pseudouridine-5'-phosphate glycosidase [Flexilinea sp.]